MKRRYKKIKKERCHKTGKVKFEEEDARRIVKNSLSSSEENRKESRYYFCHHCQTYHLTKMTKEMYDRKTPDEQLAEEEKRKAVKLSFKKKWFSLIKKGKKDESSIS